jgi:hypothetical protein
MYILTFLFHRRQNLTAWLAAHPNDPDDVEDWLKRHHDFDFDG